MRVVKHLPHWYMGTQAPPLAWRRYPSQHDRRAWRPRYGVTYGPLAARPPLYPLGPSRKEAQGRRPASVVCRTTTPKFSTCPNRVSR